MPRSYKKTFKYSASRDKYSVEHKTGLVQVPASPGQSDLIIIPSTDIEGMRKVKHIIVQGSSGVAVAESVTGLFWALVYVPAGYSANLLQRMSTTNSLYEPNQNVLCAGVWDMNGGPLRVRSPVARNLNSGDSIHLLIASTNPNSAIDVSYYVQYAITLQ